MQRETGLQVALLQVALVIVSVGFAMQIANRWPILSSRTAALVAVLLIHASVVIMFGGVLWRTHRQQPVGLPEVYGLAVVVAASWTIDLGVLR
jgi:hypothetical protein